MPSVRTLYVPRFSSQLSSSQRDEPQPDQTPDQTEPPTPSQRHRRGNKRVRGQTTRCLLKVKIPKVNNSTLSKVTKEVKTPKRWTAAPAADETKTTMSQEDAVADSESFGRDIFSFSQRPTSTAKTEKEKAKFAVLRTISRMMEENQLIRQRLASFSKDRSQQLFQSLRLHVSPNNGRLTAQELSALRPVNSSELSGPGRFLEERLQRQITLVED